jgi:hypothetical protein
VRYTHFWSTNEKLPDRLAWPRIIREARAVLDAFDSLVSAKSHTMSERYLTQTIHFDSVSATDYSEFKLGLKPARFMFCRTMRTDYDLPVTAILLVVKRHAPQWIKITSDGRWADWEPARAFLRAALDYEDEDFASAKSDFDELVKGSDEEMSLEDFLASVEASDARP